MSTPYDDFYHDVRYCPSCADYVPYLRSPGEAWCAWCGDEVRLFSTADLGRFQDDVRRARRSARPRDFDDVA